MQLHLFRLFHNESEMDSLEKESSEKQAEVEKSRKKKEKLDDELKEKKKDQGKIQRDLLKLDKRLSEIVSLLRSLPRLFFS